MCAACIVEEHIANPFHRIEVWDATLAFWSRISLDYLEGFAINLGHDGDLRTTQSNVRPMVRGRNYTRGGAHQAGRRGEGS